jgi:radical SAM superfamily enzyme YgiQ (UPF0313 family)
MREPRKSSRTIKQLLEGERNRTPKPFGSGWNVALVYPNTYHVAMSNLGFHFAYHAIATHPDFVCERFVTDFDPPVSLESQRPLADFDIIAFSISYELDYLNLLDVLSRSGIPLLAKDRTAPARTDCPHRRGGSSPLIIAGGIGVTVNANPIADFVDLIAWGDGEATLPDFLRAFADSRGNKQRTVEALADHPGFHAPVLAPNADFLEPHPAIQPADNLSPCHTIILTPYTEFAETCLMEISRGCPYRCRFCFSGYSPLPYRTFPLENVRSIIEQNIPFTKRFGFVSSAVARHPQINDLCDYCEERDLLISFSSLHLLDVSPRILKALARSRQKTLTLAPEAGNEAFRRLLGKNVSDQRILDTAEMSVRSSIENLKLYFLLGAPGESLDDCRSIVHLVKKIHALFLAASKKRGRIGAIRVQPSLFVPKPRTPFATAPMLDSAELRRRISILRRGLAPLSNVRLLPASIHEAQAQRILSLGNRKTSRFLLLAHRHAGNWRKALAEFDSA